MEKRVQKLLSRFSEVEELLGKPEVLNDQKEYRSLTQEHAYLGQVKSLWENLQKLQKQLKDNRELVSSEKDPDFVAFLEEDIIKIEKEIEEQQNKLKSLLVPPDPMDSRNTILELRAGTGGDEAALFVGDCVRMYKMLADRQGWRYEELSCTLSEIGGFKEYVMALSGTNVYRFLRHEGGTHRVQRVPETETQGRVHTSAITVAVLLEPDEESDVIIDDKELRVDTYRASGAGGQHINVTDSAVRLTHIPTGIVAYCQEERSQHKNKEKAIRLLKAKIAEIERQQKRAERASDRSKQVGTGDRSGRIRTYNFPQNRLTDHRINLTKYNLDRVMEGELEEVINALVSHFYHEKLKDDE
ncbi:MAG: peptide chain release factor 1 [Waddliaceae bacterium]